MRQTVLKISLYNGNYYDTDVEFNEDEVIQVVKGLPGTFESQVSQTQAPSLMDLSQLGSDGAGSTVWEIGIDIDFQGMNSKTRFEQIVNHTNKVKVYYEYLFDNSAYLECVVDPNYEENIFHGDYARMTGTMRFYGEAG